MWCGECLGVEAWMSLKQASPETETKEKNGVITSVRYDGAGMLMHHSNHSSGWCIVDSTFTADPTTVSTKMYVKIYTGCLLYLELRHSSLSYGTRVITLNTCELSIARATRF